MSPAAPKASPFAHRGFRLLPGGGPISALGGRSTLAAPPWSVFKPTGNPAAPGPESATMALSRAAFMPVGGFLSSGPAGLRMGAPA